MGKTVIEKIIEHNTGKEVKPGDIVTVNVDRVMIHDIFIPFVAEKFKEMGFEKLWDPDKVVLIYDHHNLPLSLTGGRLCKTGKYCIWYRQPYNYLRLCRRILFRYRLYRNGKYLRNRNHVDQGAGDH